MNMRPMLAACLLLLSTCATAQKHKDKDDDDDSLFGKKVVVGKGMVTGRVVCSDTGAPARFAKVFLKATAPDTSSMDSLQKMMAKNSAKDKADKPSAEEMTQAANVFSALADMMVSTTVGVDGTYTFNNVRPGTYYVHAQLAGYIDAFSGFSPQQMQSKDPATQAKIAAALTTVSISGTDTARGDLRLERGASIQGRVVYDDGSPAVGWTVRIVHDDAATGVGIAGMPLEDMDLNHLSEISVTDDTGRFRIAGLPAGTYGLRATIMARPLGSSGLTPISSGGGGGGMAQMFGLRLNVYSGNVFRRSDAKKISVTAAEDRTGEEITVPLRALHAVGGKVLAKADSHVVNSGTVRATAGGTDGKDDTSLQFTAAVQPDGSFRFDYLPGPATYTLRIANAQDTVTTDTKEVLFSTVATSKSTHKYGEGQTTVMVGDVDPGEVMLVVPEAAK